MRSIANQSPPQSVLTEEKNGQFGGKSLYVRSGSTSGLVHGSKQHRPIISSAVDSNLEDILPSTVSNTIATSATLPQCPGLAAANAADHSCPTKTKRQGGSPWSDGLGDSHC
jgi:hypothetical protein